MKTFKKILATILCIVMVFGSAPLAGFVGLELPSLGELFTTKAEAVTSGYYTFTVSDGGAIITDCDKSIYGNVTIPSSLYNSGSYKYYPVTAIGDSAFSLCKDLKSITIPDSVTSIGSYAFNGCNSLVNITIPDSVTSIGDYAFNGCNRLVNITIPDSVTSIGDYAFYICEKLATVTIPDSVTSIGECAFYKCTALNEISIGNGVKYIGKNAFAYDNGNKYNVYPIDIEIVDYSGTLSDWCAINFEYYTSNPIIKADRFYIKDTLISGDLVIPDTSTRISNYAFYECTSLTSVTIPNSVTSIGEYAFNGCENLTSVTIPDSVTSIGIKAFYLTSFYNNEENWINGVLYINNYLIEAKSLSGSYSVREGTKVIADYAFYGCTGLTSITIPNSVASIGDYAFYGSMNLTSATISDSVIKIGEYAFYECDALNEVSIGNGVTYIGEKAFGYDKRIQIGSSYATALANDIKNVYYSGTFADWCAIEFEDFTSNPIRGSEKFYVNGVLISEDLVIPDNVTSISANAFYSCDIFTSLTIPDSVTSIGERAFWSCNNLLNVTIGNGVTKIGDWSFTACQSLKSVIIGSNVTRIGEGAFRTCDNLKAVCYEGSADEWNKISIYEYNDPIESATKYYNVSIPDEFISGTCGENSSWSLDKSTGELVINGNGKLENLTNEYNIPSIVLSTMTKFVIIHQGITEINNSIFNDFSSIETTYYYGNRTEWQSIAIGSNNNYLTNYVIYEYETDNMNYGSGSFGNGLTWTLYLDGSLIIEGSGAIPNYSESSVPWHNVRDRITNVYIPAGVTNIGASVFNGCTNIESFSVDENNYYFTADENGVLFNYDKTKLIKYPAKSSKTEYIIPESVTSIRPYAFENALNLTTVSFGSDVSEICENAFIGCTNISLIKYAGTVTEWAAITIGEGNDALNQKMIYESGTPDAKYASGSCGTNLTWVLYENGSLVISGIGAMKNSSSLWTDYRDYILSVSFPDGITHIGNGTFSFCKNIESITLPSSVTSIGDTAFAECDKLKTVTVPYGVKTIGADAFRDCDLLESFVMPDSVTTLGDSVFYMCDSLKNVTLSKNIKTIDDYTFYKCISLESIVIPDDVTYIGYYAFNYCSQLNELTMPVTARIHNSNGVFAGCFKIDKITLTKGTTGIMLDYGTSTSTSSTTPNYEYTPWYISDPSEIVIAEGVKYLGVLAFYECFESLNSLTLPQSLNEIGELSFYFINYYTNLYYNGTLYDWCNVYINDKGTLYNAENVNPAYYADNFYINGERLEGDLVIPDGVTSIDYKTFVGINSITSVTIPDSVTEIGYKAFYYCEGLTDVKIGNGVKTIGDNAFHGCSNVTNLIIGNSVESIGNKAFMFCESLKELTIPVTAKIYNSDDTFYECKNLDKVTFTKGTTGVMLDYGENLPETSSIIDYSYTPWGMSKCKEIIIEDGVKSIGDYAFCNQSSLTSFSIPDSVTSIGEYAFYNCSGVTSITIPDGVTSIGEYAFYNCNSLTNITIPDGVTSIDEYAFYNCSGLTSITIPDSVATIGYASFYGCEGIKELTMPVSAKIYNSENTFGYCTNIDKITFTKGTGAMPDYGTSTSTSSSTTYYKYTPWYKSGTAEIVLPKGVSTIGTYAFHECSNLKTVTYEGTVDDYYEMVIKDYNEPLFNAKTNFTTYMIIWVYGDKTEKVLMRVGDKIVPPTVEVEEGYMFTGWSSEIPEVMPGENLTFIANIEEKLYNVTWIIDGEEIVEKYRQGQEITIPEVTEKIGYTFAGWTPEVPDKMYQSDLTFTAVYSANSYDATFNANGGVWSDGYDKKIVATDFDSEIIVPEAPEKQGYLFSTWSPEVGVMDDINGKTFTAQWIPATDTVYTVETYIMNTSGEYEKTVQSFSGETDSTITAEYCIENGMKLNREMSVLSGVIAADSSLVLKVYIDRNIYTFTTDIDGVVESNKYYYGSIIPEILPDKIGYTFIGWDKDMPSTMPAEDLTITAVFEVNNYDAVFNANGGSWADGDFEKIVSTEYGSEIVIPENPEKRGYIFSTWSPEVGVMDDINGKIFTAKWIPATDTVYTVETYIMNTSGEYEKTVQSFRGTTEETVFAEYNIPVGFRLNTSSSVLSGEILADSSLVLKVYIDRISYKFTTVIDGVSNVTEYLYEAEIKEPDEPSKIGYTFIGWNRVIPLTMPAEDVTVTAVFTVNNYNAVFNANGGSWSDGETVKIVSTEYGSEIVAPNSPSRDEYVFLKWTPEVGIMDDVNGKTYNAEWVSESDIIYTVETYKMDTLGNYEKTSQSYVGTVDETVVAEYIVSEGFSLNASKSILEGNVKVDGSLLLKVYLDRNTYTFTMVVDDVSQSTKYIYGSMISEPSPPVKSGYKFVGWDNTIPSTMPANDITVTAMFELSFKMSIRNPSTTTISYGDSIILHADMNVALPSGWRVDWTADNGNFSYTTNGDTCTITPSKSGDTTFTATVYDENGNEISKDTQTMKSKAGFFDKIIAFFKKIFGATKTIPQIYKGIF